MCNADCGEKKCLIRCRIVMPLTISTNMMRSTFTVVAKGNAVMLQAIVAPPRDLFNELARESRAAAKAAGMRPSDITAAIREAHAERRAARAKGKA